ncbi:hypothetical protein BASA81_006304 [Batrachochytrium salamandrivorans]|nr:hypothetical protein BASA81_006304 [Batrachochytrium salamandrivorans]
MVKFAEKLASSRVTEWSEYYVDYNSLKKLIKSISRKQSELKELDQFSQDLNNDNRDSPQSVRMLSGEERRSGSGYGSVDTYNQDGVQDEENGLDDDPDQEFLQAVQFEGNKAEEFYLEKVHELQERLKHLRESVDKLREKIMSSHSVRTLKRPQSSYYLGVGGSGAQSDSDSEEDTNNNAASTRDMHAKASLKRSFNDIYTQMNLVLGFATLNYTAMVKIVKKYDKATRRSSKKRAMQLIHSSFTFSDALEAKRLIAELERKFAQVFHGNNLALARDELVSTESDMDFTEVLHLGFRVGVSISLLFWVLWVMTMDGFEHDRQISASIFIVYRGLSTFVLCLWLWALCVAVWQAYRVNFIFLFQFNPKDVPRPLDLARKASTVSVLFLSNMLLFVKTSTGELEFLISAEHATWFPLMLFVYMLTDATYHGMGSGRVFRSVLFAPFFEVTFFDSFVGDVMTSLVRPFVDVAFSFCFFGTGEWREPQVLQVKDSTQSECMNSWAYRRLLVPLMISLPLWFRFAQCLRRYYDTGLRHPNLTNATKYAIAYSVVLLGTLERAGLETSMPNFYTWWFTSAVLNSLITFSWDVVFDWGLFKQPGVVLRERLMYTNTWFYYLAIAFDLILRFMWTITLFPSVVQFFGNGGTSAGIASADSSAWAMYATAFLGWFEACRRCMWSLFRVEHEHLNNAFGFRRVDFVPLHFDVKEREERPQLSMTSKVRFFGEFVVFLALVLSVAYFAFSWQVRH